MWKYYLLLSGSIILEVIGASFMKLSDGFSNTGASITFIVLYFLSLALYIILTKRTELGIVNALWSGGGTVLVAVSGIMFLQESFSMTKFFGIACVVIGVIGLNLPKRKKHKETRKWKEAV
ncbi:DMT family transporter [Alkalicoccus saliphilus]|jgi:small multidrug resistance pump|uniref:QacE family quaternary ammonium compound efflux SMR transporter n=1 Tax=Alkalicoccus saliphilus TaxID=200989 RepID=A0A2T4U6M4_9BACI|nr:multidrug efflux SMR transporter [Alkalicoccus saliphilus]PTL39053.1 QacE family quaternary ammonium compound efflux SMR transporter [Alkalicoccus saliphilus]